MKRPVITILIVVTLILSAVGAGWLYYQANPDEWDAFVAELSGEETASSTPSRANRPTVRSGGLIASGNIEADEVIVATEIGGRVITVNAIEGDTVTGGDILLQLDQQTLLAQREGAAAAVSQAEAVVAATVAELALARAGATSEELAAGEAAVLSAQGSVAMAEAALIQAEVDASSARTIQETESSVAMAEANLNQAQGMVTVAEANLAAATAELARLQAGTRAEEIAIYQGLLDQAQSNFLYYENIHYTNFIQNNIGGAPEEQARFLREGARGARDAAEAQLNLARSGASSQEVAIFTAAVQAAEGQLAIAEAGVAAAEAELARAQSMPTTSEDRVIIADAGIAAARAQVDISQGQFAQAEAQLARLRAGATPQAIAALEAQVDQAKAALATAAAVLKTLDIQISFTTLQAPVGGVILQQLIHTGELAAPGAPLFTLADLDKVTLTVYVPEAELGRVALGQAAEVSVDSYSNTFQGEVSYIASQAEFTPKNVQTQEERVHMVFAIKIRLDNSGHLLKPGMPADAVFAELND